MFESIREKIKLNSTRRKLEISEAEYEVKQYELATKRLQEASNIVVDNELKDWNLLSSDGVLSESDHQDLLTSAYNLYHNNVHARAIVRTLVKFVLGIGPNIEPENGNKKVLDVWRSFIKINKFSRREKEIGTRLFRDGEVFLRKFINKRNGEVKLRFIRPLLIANPNDKQLAEHITYGIETNPDDVEDVRAYWKVDGEGKFKERIDAEGIIHVKIFADSDEKRGTSIYKLCAKRIKQYDDWLEDRIILNKVRSAIALVRKVSGSAQKIKSIRDKQRSDTLPSDKMRQKTPYRGTIITASKDIEYEMMSPNINATDVAEDGRAMLLSIAAGVGFPEMMFTADYSNANYSSSLIAQNPFVREIEEWQDFFRDFYQELYEVVIQAAIDYGELPDKTKLDCVIEFPPLIAADVEKIAKAYEILYKYKIVSKKTWRYKMGLINDLEEAYIEDEEIDEMPPLAAGPIPVIPGQKQLPGPAQPGGKSPFNMPMSPVNQFGSELVEALKDGDWDRIIEIGELIEDAEPITAAVEDKNWEKVTELSELIGEKIKEGREELKDVIKYCATMNAEAMKAIGEGLKDIKIENIINSPDVNITTPEIAISPPNIVVESPNIVINPEIKLPKQKAPKIIQEVKSPETNTVIIKEERKKKTKKTVLYNKEGKVSAIEEEEVDNNS